MTRDEINTIAARVTDMMLQKLTDLLQGKRSETMTSRTFPINPYRHGSKLHTIFNSLADGMRHSIEFLTDAAYFPGAGNRPIYRRRVASAIRTIRASGLCGDVIYNTDGYVMVARTAAVVDSPPVGVL